MGDGQRLTNAGTKLLARAQDVMNRLIDTRSEIGALDERPTGVLCVSCLPTFGRLHVLPVVAKLIETRPDLGIELDLTERLSDPATERCDVAIRIGEQLESGLIATRIGSQRWMICAAPSYLDRHGRPAVIEAVADHRRIGKARELPDIGWSRAARAGIDLTDSARVFRCDEFEAQRQATLSGIGLAMLPNWVVASDITARRLVTLFDEPIREAAPILILRALQDASAKMRVFIDAMRKDAEVS